MFDNFRAHPFQGLLSMLGNIAVPGSGFATNRLFGAYNNAQFNNATQANQARVTDQMGLDTNAAMNRPLNGSLGLVTGMPGYTGGYEGGQSDPGGMLGMMGYGGGPQQQGGYNGPSMSGQQWIDSGGGYGNIAGQMLGLAPDQPTGFVNSLLDNISAGPGLPGTGNFGQPQHGHMTPGDRRDMGGIGNTGGGALYGVSNFMVGGSPVINGVNGDPNGLYVNHHWAGY